MMGTLSTLELSSDVNLFVIYSFTASFFIEQEYRATGA
jgi:hypothetical protein